MKRLFLLIAMMVSGIAAYAQTDKAKEMYAEATSGKVPVEEYLSGDFASVDSISMHDMAVMFYKANDFVSAGTCWEIALGKVKKHGKAYEQIINCLSLVYDENANPEKFQWLFQVIEEHNKYELSKPCNDYKCKLERAQYYIVQGDEVQAKTLIKESLDLCETDEQFIEVESAYARILFDIRDFESAAQYYFSVAERWKKLGDNEKYASSMYFSAQNYLLSGKYSIAEDNSRKAVEAAKVNTSEKGKNDYVIYLACLGDALYCRQKYAEALDVYKQEMNECIESFPNTESHADALQDVGKVMVRTKQFDEAKKYLQQACDLYKGLGLDSKYSNTYGELVICLRKAGENDAADSMEQEADNKRKEVWQRLLDSELESLPVTEKYLSSMVYTNSLNTIAGCYFGLDKYKDAAHYYALYTENIRDMLREKFLLLTDKDRIRVWNEQQQNFDDFRYNIAVLPDSETELVPLFVPTLYDMELISKGIMLNSVIEFEKVLERNADKKLLDVYHKIKKNQQQIDELQSVASDDNLQKVLDLKRDNTSLQKELMTGCAVYGDYTEYLSITWRDVQKKLGPDDVAIEFTTVSLSPLNKDNYVLALILASTGEPVMSVVSTKAILNNLKSKDDLYDNSQYYQFIWGFMEKHLAGKKRVYFAPDNNLSDIAIEYLTDGSQTFFEKYEVYRLSSTKELCRNYSEASDKKTITLFGDIDYNTDRVSDTKSLSSFGKLKYSKDEIDGIVSKVRKVYEFSRYDGRKASEAQFRKLSGNNPQILHISSHGEYWGDDKTPEEEAMDNSVIALSGANSILTDASNDGIITAHDVAQMNLRQCDFVVLSACNTGLGGKSADGIFGLQRGFKNAGVHSLLMSLKPVYDESTSKLMIAFYNGLAKGKSKRQSLLDAQSEIKAMGYSEGKYWAPFILLDAIE